MEGSRSCKRRVLPVLQWCLITFRAAETAQMTARLGRASYVGGESLPPDPGAVGIAALVEGIANALGEK